MYESIKFNNNRKIENNFNREPTPLKSIRSQEQLHDSCLKKKNQRISCICFEQ